MLRVLVIGGSGMAGHLIATYLSENKFEVWATIRKKNILLNQNIKQVIWNNLDFHFLKKLIEESKFDVVINAAGILNSKVDDNQSEAILINSYLPHFLVDLTVNMKTMIIHLSTDCVFSGEKGKYNECSYKDGKSFYDLTKSLGEFKNSKDIIFRNSIIGPDLNVKGIGLFNWFMSQQQEIIGYTNWFWSGITTFELAKKIKAALINNYRGLYHLTNNTRISKYDLLILFKKIFNQKILINKKSLNKKIDKSLIDTQKKDFFEIPSYEIMILEMREWIKTHSNLYKYKVD